MAEQSFVPLAGSERSPLPGLQEAGPVDGSARIEVTLITRRRAELPPGAGSGPAALSREQLAARHGTDPADLDLIATVLARHGIEVTGADAAARRVQASAPAAVLAATFGARLRRVRSPRPGTAGEMAEHRYREGGLQIPAELAGIVLAVLGLDDRPQARAHFRHAGPAPAAVSYTPVQVASLYRFPAGTDGTGQTIAIVELGGGFSAGDLDTYFGSLGIPVPQVTAAGVDGGSNQPGRAPSGADGEVLLDIEVAGAVAPGARQVVYFAPNTDRGFIDAVLAAAHASPSPTVISISWGQSEDAWTGQARTALDQAIADAAALGATVCAAAGDNGSSDSQSGTQPHADFPASSPHALACGGTTLHGDPATGTVTSETVWNDGPGRGATGGGVSDVFALPPWQSAAGVPARPGGGTGRGVPDVAGNADPATGYQVLVDGQRTVIGGTSAVAPLWAGLLARLAQATGLRFGLLQTRLYAGVSAGTPAPGFRDITSGSNGAYTAAPGWDPCTGLGSPDGSALLGRLRGTGG